jgi:hypothetical protein
MAGCGRYRDWPNLPAHQQGRDGCCGTTDGSIRGVSTGPDAASAIRPKRRQRTGANTRNREWSGHVSRFYTARVNLDRIELFASCPVYPRLRRADVPVRQLRAKRRPSVLVRAHADQVAQACGCPEREYQVAGDYNRRDGLHGERL